ncbi:MAG TPA: hypothetical protein VMV92_19025 [Streptosporangiaceae bacterium]|nr:hypothetical protein [Streptosporangiaceae bacterium]
MMVVVTITPTVHRVRHLPAGHAGVGGPAGVARRTGRFPRCWVVGR